VFLEHGVEILDVPRSGGAKWEDSTTHSAGEEWALRCHGLGGLKGAVVETMNNIRLKGPRQGGPWTAGISSC
jgi:hypothetical protein